MLSPPSPSPGITLRYSIYALLVIFAANFLSYLDRQIVSGLESELEKAFDLSRAAFGWLWSTFTVGYMIFAPLVAYLATSGNRPRIFAVCIFVWSLATIWSGWATYVPELFIARFLIGLGEAGCLVIGPTMISDYFRKEVRGKALSVFFLALPLGGPAGYITAAVVTQYFGTWRDAFFFAGVPGLVLALLVWLLVDPPRGGESADLHGHGGKFEGFAPYLALLKNRTLMLIILAQAFAVIILVPLLHYGIRYVELKFQLNKIHATECIVPVLIAGCVAMAFSGLIGDRLARRIQGGYALLAGVGYILAAPLLIVGFLATSKTLMVAALTSGGFFLFLCMPAVNTQIANSVSPQTRAMAFALAVFILHLLGDTLAPPVFGRVDELLGERATLRLIGAASTTGIAADPLSGVTPFLAAATLQAERMHRTVMGRQIAFVTFSCALFLAGACSLLAVRTARRDESVADAPRESPPDDGSPPGE